MHTHIHTHIHTYIHACTPAHTHAHTQTHIYIHACVYCMRLLYMCACIYVYACMYICMYACVHTCMYVIFKFISVPHCFDPWAANGLSPWDIYRLSRYAPCCIVRLCIIAVRFLNYFKLPYTTYPFTSAPHCFDPWAANGLSLCDYRDTPRGASLESGSSPFRSLITLNYLIELIVQRLETYMYTLD